MHACVHAGGRAGGRGHTVPSQPQTKAKPVQNSPSRGDRKRKMAWATAVVALFPTCARVAACARRR